LHPLPATPQERARAKGRRRWLDAAIAVALLTLVVAAIVNVVRDGPVVDGQRPPQTEAEPPPSAETTRSRDAFPEQLPRLLPLPGELREAGGLLWWSSTGCRAGALALSSGEVTQIQGERCRVWPAPEGHAAFSVTARRAAALEGRGLEYITLEGDQRVVQHTPGFIGAEVAWSVDGRSSAVCIGSRIGTIVDVFRQAPGERDEIEDRCFPAFLASGRLALAGASPARIELDGRTIVGGEAIARVLPSRPKGFRRAVSALSGRGETLVAGLVAVSERKLLPASSAIVVFDADGRAVFTLPLFPAETLPAAVGLSPAGDAVWYFDAGEGEAVVVAVPGGRRLSFFTARWISWSPDGRYLAAATTGGISLRRWPSGEEVALVPVEASDVAWTRSP
jgi:hypothetical protein